MSVQKSVRELLRKLPGWEAELTSRHIRLVHSETGATVISSKTPSDHRTIKNTMANCQRALKEKTG